MTRPAFIWVFNSNRRVYAQPPKGRIYSGEGPIWREHWQAWPVTGETRVSWILQNGAKVPKKGASPALFAFSEESVTQQAWIHDHCHRLADRVGRIKDYAVLTEIAKLAGYPEATR